MPRAVIDLAQGLGSLGGGVVPRAATLVGVIPALRLPGLSLLGSRTLL